ncbi:MAG TPA: site-specific integrase [Acidimicrobiia bacterium]
MFQARRAHIELFARWLEANGRARATVARRLSTITGFYRYCVEEQLIPRSPAVHIRRPKLNYESNAVVLDRNELGMFLVQAGLSGGRDHGLACLLALNGLGISEAQRRHRVREPAGYDRPGGCPAVGGSAADGHAARELDRSWVDPSSA